MASRFIPFIILTGLIGFQCQVVQVSKVSVKVGNSISVPCLYDQSYHKHVKYLCRGGYWGSCSYAVKTNAPDNTGKFSISDDTDQRIFTVTINNLDNTKDNTQHWCVVEIPGIWRDIGTEFQLSITDTPSLYVDQQEFMAFEGGSVTVVCYYTKQRVKKWCRLGSTCINQQTGSINGATVTISTTVPKVYNVTMSGLTQENSGWYLCANDDSQMPVRIMVQKRTLTTARTTVNTKTEEISGKLPTSTQLVPILTGDTLNQSTLPNSTQSQTAGNSAQDKHSSQMIILIATLISLLLLLVAAALAGWRIRRYKTKPEAQDISMPENDTDVLYTTIIRRNCVSAKEKDNISEESPTYSNTAMRAHVQQAIEPADGNVIYSAVK